MKRRKNFDYPLQTQRLSQPSSCNPSRWFTSFENRYFLRVAFVLLVLLLAFATGLFIFDNKLQNKKIQTQISILENSLISIFKSIEKEAALRVQIVGSFAAFDLCNSRGCDDCPTRLICRRIQVYRQPNIISSSLIQFRGISYGNKNLRREKVTAQWQFRAEDSSICKAFESKVGTINQCFQLNIKYLLKLLNFERWNFQNQTLFLWLDKNSLFETRVELLGIQLVLVTRLSDQLQNYRFLVIGLLVLFAVALLSVLNFIPGMGQNFVGIVIQQSHQLNDFVCNKIRHSNQLEPNRYYQRFSSQLQIINNSFRGLLRQRGKVKVPRLPQKTMRRQHKEQQLSLIRSLTVIQKQQFNVVLEKCD